MHSVIQDASGKTDKIMKMKATTAIFVLPGDEIVVVQSSACTEQACDSTLGIRPVAGLKKILIDISGCSDTLDYWRQ